MISGPLPATGERLEGRTTMSPIGSATGVGEAGHRDHAATPLRRVLLVTTDFPPDANAGRFRALKLLRLLPRYGWTASVLTVSPDVQADPRLWSEIPPGAHVVRAWFPQLRSRLVKSGKQVVANRAKQTSVRVPLWRRGARLISAGCSQMGRHLMIPDAAISWVPFAVVQALRICRRVQPDVILTTAPGFSSFIVGYLVKRLTGLPWVAEYRDLWSGDVLREWMPMWRARLEGRLERVLLRQADTLVAVTETYRQRLAALHCAQGINRTRFIPNGQDFGQAAVSGSDGPAVIPGTFVYTGHLYDTRNPAEFFEAFGLVAEQFRQHAVAPQCILAGTIEPEVHAALERITNRGLAAPSSFRLVGRLLHDESIRLQRSAFALLLFVNRGSATEGVIPGKLFEYIAARRPIIAISDGGECARIVQQGRLGWVAPYEVEAIRSLLGKILCDPNRSVRDAYQPDWAYLMNFDETTMAARVADTLFAVSGRKRSDASTTATREPSSLPTR